MDVWYNTAKAMVGAYLALFVHKIHVVGRENIPDGPKIIVANHALASDAFILPWIFRDKVHCLIQADIFSVPLIGKMLALADQIPVVAGLPAYLRWVAGVPSDAGWGLGDEFARVMTPVSRIVVASILAELVAELADTEVYHWFVTRVTKRHQWSRVLVSNSVSVPLDSLLFAVLAFAPLPALPGLPWAAVMDILLFNVAVKYAVTLVSLPLIYATPEPRTDARP